MVATFGTGTARAAVEAGITVRAMAPTPQVPSMTKALDLFIAGIGAGEDIPGIQIGQSSKVDDFVRAQETRPSRKSRKRPASGATPVKAAATKQSGAKS
jgi:uroporphyrinogen-III synthase